MSEKEALLLNRQGTKELVESGLVSYSRSDCNLFVVTISSCTPQNYRDD